MIKRRLAFATPFVVVASCKAPAPASPREAERADEAEEEPVIVSLPQPIDAPDAVAPPGLEEAAQVSANGPTDPRASRDRARLGEGDAPWPAIRAELVEQKPDGYEGSVVTFDAGYQRGVTPQRATARLLRDDSNEPLNGGQIKITHCGDYSCKGMVTLRPDVVSRNPHVEIRMKEPGAPEPEFVETRRPITCCVNPPPPPRPPKPPEPPKPTLTRILVTRFTASATEIVIGVGTDAGVSPDQYVGQVLVRDSSRPMPGGQVMLTSCKRTTCTGTVKLTVDQLRENSTVSVRRKDVGP